MFTVERKQVPITFCGQSLFIQEFSARDLEQFETLCYEVQTNRANNAFRRTLLSLCLVNAHGEKVATVEDLAEVPAREIITAANKALELNQLNRNAVDDLEKNSVDNR
ncbi:hypothetical protein GC163_13270 [bacterium]|nr:hypothetical protein [bacterium]